MIRLPVSLVFDSHCDPLNYEYHHNQQYRQRGGGSAQCGQVWPAVDKGPQHNSVTCVDPQSISRVNHDVAQE